MAGREWMITKVAGSILAIVTLVSICIGGANIVIVMQKDISRIDSDMVKVVEEVDENADDIHALELAAERNAAQFNELLRNQERIVRHLENLERVE